MTSMSLTLLSPRTSSTPANVEYVVFDATPNDPEEERDALRTTSLYYVFGYLEMFSLYVLSVPLFRMGAAALSL